jgi:DNA-binding CsgD family transcriptional regulator
MCVARWMQERDAPGRTRDSCVVAIVGRDRELSAARRFLGALEGESGCLVLAGEGGIGKTTVWRATVEEAEARGCRVLSCRPAAAEARLSFAGLSDLVRGGGEGVLAGLPAPQRHALEVALLEVEPGLRPPQRRAVFAGFCSVLFALAEAGPVLVAVDDVQWLDGSSQAALEFAVRRFGRRPIGLVCSLRTGESGRLSAGLARALEESGAEHVAVGALSVGALHELVAGKLGHNLARPTVVRIAAAAQGNPFYALEVVREMARRGVQAPVHVLPVPDDLSDLVAARVRRLPHATREALLVAAALRSPRLELLDRAALGSAEEAGLIEVGREQVTFSHPLFAAAVYGSAPMPRRRELHRRLATVVGDPEERARHLALGAEEPSEDLAVELEAAADRSVARGAPDAAAELMELAVRLSPAGSERTAPRVLRAAECHFHAGDRTRAHTLAEEVLTGSPTASVRGRALKLLGEVRYHADSFRDAVALFEEALVALGDDPTVVELHVNLAFAHWNLGNMVDAARHGDAAAQAAAGAAATGPAAAALAISAMAGFYVDQPLDRARIEKALALEDLDQQVVLSMHPSLVAGVVEFFSDNLDRAAALLLALRQRLLDRGEDSSLPHLDVDLSMIERTRGDLRAASGFSSEAYEIARTLESRTAQALALAERAYVRAVLGDVEGAREDAALVLAMGQQTEIGYAAGWRRSAIALLELSLGDAAAASESLEPLSAGIESAGACNPTATSFGLPDAIEALIAVGELERAEALGALLERHARSHDRASALARAARCRALAAAARGEPETAQAEVEQALAQHARVAMPLELGRTLLVKGQIERRSKRKRAARESFHEALETFVSIGARLWAERARAEIERTGVRHQTGDALTPTELRVAELAADGLTNKRIADAVFISAKTVEANLARVYLKLGIRSRAELGRAMAERRRG